MFQPDCTRNYGVGQNRPITVRVVLNKEHVLPASRSVMEVDSNEGVVPWCQPSLQATKNKEGTA